MNPRRPIPSWRAQRRRRVAREYAYDLLMKDEGKGFIYSPILNYRDGNLDFLEDLQAAGDTSIRCQMVARIAAPSAMRPRPPSCSSTGCATAKARISLEHAIKRQCRDTALLYGLEDRGLLAPGYLADVNVIDMERLKLGKPWLAFDLPAGGKRLLQKADGYDARSNPGR
jgi:N-acyl-D-amino-acid deacylase